MVPLLRNAAAPWDRPAYSVVQYRNRFGRSVSTERWRYAEWDRGAGGAMLLDRANDPRERKNLAVDPARRRPCGDEGLAGQIAGAGGALSGKTGAMLPDTLWHVVNL